MEILEDEEQGKPTKFVSKLIPKLLGDDNFPKPLIIDHAHRSLPVKASPGVKPSTIISRVHHLQDKELILRDMESKGQKVFIFPDYTMEVMEQCDADHERGGGEYSLRFPAKLHVHHNSITRVFTKLHVHHNGITRVFTKPEEAASYVLKTQKTPERVKSLDTNFWDTD